MNFTYCELCHERLSFNTCHNPGCPNFTLKQGEETTTSTDTQVNPNQWKTEHIYREELRGPLTKFSKPLDDARSTLMLVERGAVELSKEKVKLLRGEVLLLQRCEEKLVSKAVDKLLEEVFGLK